MHCTLPIEVLYVAQPGTPRGFIDHFNAVFDDVTFVDMLQSPLLPEELRGVSLKGYQIKPFAIVCTYILIVLRY